MATQNNIEWLNFDNTTQEMTLKYAMTSIVEGYDEPAKKKVEPIVVKGNDYLSLFGLMAKITINEKEYEAPLGLIVSYMASCAIKLQQPDWEFSATEEAVFADAGLKFFAGLQK